MGTVTIRQLPGGRIKQLQPSQADQFLAELLRVKVGWWFAPVRGRPPARVAPEIGIEVNRRGRIRSYELYGAQVLYDVRHRHRYQFYMGLLLNEWLYS